MRAGLTVHEGLTSFAYSTLGRVLICARRMKSSHHELLIHFPECRPNIDDLKMLQRDEWHSAASLHPLRPEDFFPLQNHTSEQLLWLRAQPPCPAVG